MESSEMYHYHSWEAQPRQVKVKLEKNSKGYNWEVSVEAPTADAAIALVDETNSKLRALYGGE